MIPPNRVDVLESGLAVLAEFGARTQVRGRFVSLYLGLRRIGDGIPALGGNGALPARDLEQFLDRLYTKTHRPDPLVVLTAPFGQSTSPTAPYSSRSGETAPGHNYPTNTWRNNFNIQKGIGCPAEPAVIAGLLNNPARRLACPHMANDPEGRHLCSIQGTTYRGEEHSIWLRMVQGVGYQVVDLNHPTVYQDYLSPGGDRIPIFALIAALYCLAPNDMYPTRERVGIPDFAEDFEFDLSQVRDLFDCDPDSPDNAVVLARVEESAPAPPSQQPLAPTVPPPPPAPLPLPSPATEINSGVGAELLVAEDLTAVGWNVLYRGNQRGIGYDLEATREDAILRVEVKSSVSFVDPELSESEWLAAQTHGAEYILAVVEFYGSTQQNIWYVRDPAGSAIPVERIVTRHRFPRADVFGLATEAEFL